MVPGGDSLPRPGRSSEPREHFGASNRQVFPRADVKRHALPAPGIHLQLQRSERFHVRIGRDALFLPVAAELPADQIVRLDGRDRFQYLDLLIANGLTVHADRRLHRKIAQDLEEMVLDHIANGAGLIVETAAAFHTEDLRHGDLRHSQRSFDSRKAP